MQLSSYLYRVGAALATVVALAGLPTAARAADAQSADSGTPVRVVGTMEGRLDSGARAAFAYYRFDYPGGGRVVSINMQVEPDLPTVLQNAGFRVYGPQRGRTYLTSGLQPGLVPNVTGDLVSQDAGVYVVQVYNYTPTVPIAFSIWVNGLAAGAVTSPQDAGTPDLASGAAIRPTGQARTVQQASTPETAIALTRALPGHLDAGPESHFAYYRFNYQAGTLATINMSVTPADGSVLGRVGFRIYGPRSGWVYATSGAQPGMTPNVSGDMRSADTGEYVIQVYDFDTLSPIDFVISGTGIPQRALEPTVDSTDPSTDAVPLPGN
jgi:hypothetical protein